MRITACMLLLIALSSCVTGPVAGDGETASHAVYIETSEEQGTEPDEAEDEAEPEAPGDAPAEEDLAGDGAQEIITVDEWSHIFLRFDGNSFFEYALPAEGLSLISDYTVSGQITLTPDGYDLAKHITLNEREMKALARAGQAAFVKGGVRMPSGQFIDRTYLHPSYTCIYSEEDNTAELIATYYAGLFTVDVTFDAVFESDHVKAVYRDMELTYDRRYFLFEYEHITDTPETGVYGYAYPGWEGGLDRSRLIYLGMPYLEFDILHNGLGTSAGSRKHTEGHIECYTRYWRSPNALYLNFTFTDCIDYATKLDYMALRMPYLETAAGLSIDDDVKKMVALYGGSDEDGLHIYRSRDGVYGMDIMIRYGYVSGIDIFRMDAPFLAREKPAHTVLDTYHLDMDVFELAVSEGRYVFASSFLCGRGYCYDRYDVNGLYFYYGGKEHGKNYRLEHIVVHSPVHAVELDGAFYSVGDEMPQGAVFSTDGYTAELIGEDGLIREIMFSRINPLFRP